MQIAELKYIVLILIFVLLGCEDTTTNDFGNEKNDDDGDNTAQLGVDGDATSGVNGEGQTKDPESDGSLYPPMLTDPALLPNIFGNSMESTNIDYGETLEGTFKGNRPYIPYTFDTLPGGRVTISVVSKDKITDPFIILYGPKARNGLWGGAIAKNDNFADTQDAVINDFPIHTPGQYLILVTSTEIHDNSKFAISLGCRNQCKEPECPDLTCQRYCPSDTLTQNNGCPTCICDTNFATCTSDSDCPKDHSCVNNTCVKATSPTTEPCDYCPMEYDPVCGEDGLTYVNKCQAECRGVNIKEDEACKTGTPSSCFFDSDCPDDLICKNGQCEKERNCNCPDYFDPVCGGDGKTYPNECELKCFGQNIIHKGACGQVGTCKPVCKEGVWLDSCTGNSVSTAKCTETCTSICQSADTKEEGWYSSCDKSLIEYADCAKGCGCPTVYEPVCGSDEKTYNNQCEADCANIKTAYSGECGWDKQGCETDKDCPTGYTCTVDDSCTDPTTNNPCPAKCVPSTENENCKMDADCPGGMTCVKTSYYDGENVGICKEINEQDCIKTGCHMEICSPSPVSTDCNKWDAKFSCLKEAKCTLDSGASKCIWDTSSKEYDQCISEIDASQSCNSDADCEQGDFCQNNKCIKSDCICPSVEKLVCGSDGKTYKNECLMNCAEVKLLHLGGC